MLLLPDFVQLEDAVEAAQDAQRQDDLPVLARLVVGAEQIDDRRPPMITS